VSARLQPRSETCSRVPLPGLTHRRCHRRVKGLTEDGSLDLYESDLYESRASIYYLTKTYLTKTYLTKTYLTKTYLTKTYLIKT
jgi:hypothetical protein